MNKCGTVCPVLPDDTAQAIAGNRAMVQEFHYSVPLTLFTTGQNKVLTVPVYSDSYFVVKKIMAQSTGIFQTRVINTATGRLLTSDYVNNANLFGNAQLPKGASNLQWFAQVVNIAFPSGGETWQSSLRIDADADFLIRKIVSTQTGAYTLKITDSTSQSYWYDQAQHNSVASGTAQYPFTFSKPRLVQKNSSINFELTDLSLSPNNVQLILEGAKVYR